MGKFLTDSAATGPAGVSGSGRSVVFRDGARDGKGAGEPTTCTERPPPLTPDFRRDTVDMSRVGSRPVMHHAGGISMKSIDARILELRHRALDRQIHKLDRRGEHMTPEERV